MPYVKLTLNPLAYTPPYYTASSQTCRPTISTATSVIPSTGYAEDGKPPTTSEKPRGARNAAQTTKTSLWIPKHPSSASPRVRHASSSPSWSTSTVSSPEHQTPAPHGKNPRRPSHHVLRLHRSSSPVFPDAAAAGSGNPTRANPLPRRTVNLHRSRPARYGQGRRGVPDQWPRGSLGASTARRRLQACRPMCFLRPARALWEMCIGNASGVEGYPSLLISLSVVVVIASLTRRIRSPSSACSFLSFSFCTYE